MAPISENDLLKKIKSKKELSGIDDKPILEEIARQIRKKSFSFPMKKKQEKSLIKLVRAELRKLSGQFILNKINVKKAHNKLELLKAHASTRERIEFYPKLIKLIISLKASSIIDLGCGLNPVALAGSFADYHAYDINKDILSMLNNYFKKSKSETNIRTSSFDIRKDNLAGLPSADLCLLLKVLDLADNKGHKRAEQILKEVKCRYFIASFPVKTLSGRPMSHPQRGWIERLLGRLEYKFSIIKSKNEIFYIIEKPSRRKLS